RQQSACGHAGPERKAGPPAPRTGLAQGSVCRTSSRPAGSWDPQSRGLRHVWEPCRSTSRMETTMPARPLIDKAIIMRLLDEFAEYGLSEEEIDVALVRDGPVDLDLLAECKREHPYFNRPPAKTAPGRIR